MASSHWFLENHNLGTKPSPPLVGLEWRLAATITTIGPSLAGETVGFYWSAPPLTMIHIELKTKN
jgi:hypothetical protein